MAGTTNGGPACTSDCINITLTNVDIHPAAKAALQSIGFPIPDLTRGSPYNEPYGVSLNGISIDFLTLSPVFTPLGMYFINSTGPYTFSLPSSTVSGQSLGILSGVSMFYGDGGGAAPPDGGGATPVLVQPTCAEWATMVTNVGSILDAGGTADTVSGYLADAGFVDYVIPSGTAVGGVAQPPSSDVTNGVSYAIPLSYEMMLNCAGDPTKTSRDTDTGVALCYATNGTTPGLGTPISGVSYSVSSAGNNPSAVYFSSDYTQTNANATDATGLGYFVNVEPGTFGFGTVSASDPQNDTFTPSGSAIATQPNSAFNILLNN